MADIRITGLPDEPTPNQGDYVAIDLSSTRKTTVKLLTEAGRPAASQGEAQSGTNPEKAMTPLTTKQAIDFQVPLIAQPISADLSAIAAITTTGMLSRTGSPTWETRTITGTVNEVSVVDGDGVSGNPTISLTGNTAGLSAITTQAGDIIYVDGTNTINRLPLGSVNQILQISGGAPSWQFVAGTGDVVGPSSSPDNGIVTYDGATGKLLKADAPTMSDILNCSRGPMPTMANNGTDATNDIDFTAGAAFSTDSTHWPMVAASSVTKRLDAAWAVGTNSGGRMSAAAIANTTYHCYMIRRPDTGVVDFGFDTSPSAPTLPANYTQYRRIGSIIRESGAIVSFLQIGDIFKRGAFTEYASGAAVTNVLLTLTALPAGIQVEPIIRLLMSTSNVNIALSVGSGSSANADLSFGGTSTAAASVELDTAAGGFFTNTSRQIRITLSNPGGGTVTAMNISSCGWIDNRGKDFNP